MKHEKKEDERKKKKQTRKETKRHTLLHTHTSYKNKKNKTKDERLVFLLFFIISPSDCPADTRTDRGGWIVFFCSFFLFKYRSLPFLFGFFGSLSLFFRVPPCPTNGKRDGRARPRPFLTTPTAANRISMIFFCFLAPPPAAQQQQPPLLVHDGSNDSLSAPCLQWPRPLAPPPGHAPSLCLSHLPPSPPVQDLELTPPPQPIQSCSFVCLFVFFMETASFFLRFYGFQKFNGKHAHTLLINVDGPTASFNAVDRQLFGYTHTHTDTHTYQLIYFRWTGWPVVGFIGCHSLPTCTRANTLPP